MGDHYLPQYYLKGFSLNEGKRIWVYDKQENRRYPTQVKSTANETGFYSTEAGSTEVEQYLANSIENPANPVLEKIRNRERVTKADKKVLSVYMTTMIKRVPQSKEILKGRAPNVAAEVYSEFCERLSVLNDGTPSAEEEIESLRTEAREVLDRFVEDFPKDVWLKTLSPEMTPKVVAAFTAMTWVFVVSEGGPVFLTCDDPVCFFRDRGIGKPKSEVTFPISSKIALWLTWRQDLCEGYFIPPRFVLKEVTRRVAKNAARFLYHALDEDWILPFARKGKWDLHRLNLRQERYDAL
jgi:hypothetical protein